MGRETQQIYLEKCTRKKKYNEKKNQQHKLHVRNWNISIRSEGDVNL